ncbi:MAG: type III-B CRISPR module RAMP protein Cmr6 [Bacteroidales bacterium]|jgi:CRISPR-associated protein Cmr6|nr:type III-B CRISPR module RAMP protein Cmr6 [Bacteroidales bacterium]
MNKHKKSFNQLSDLKNILPANYKSEVNDNSRSQQLQDSISPHANLGLLFYKKYFEDLKLEYLLLPEKNPSKEREKLEKENAEEIKKRNRRLIENCPLWIIDNEIADKYLIPLTVSYPGLITGVGINHEAGIEGEFKLGVHFDYTYGMPVVYGSSVKGVLKTFFADFLKEMHQGLDAVAFEKDIFEGQNNNGNKSIYDRDIFFDAVIVNANKKSKILDSDTLCPHDENPLKNPIPISFLKIASGVKMEFRFKLVNSKIGEETFNADDKKKLFEKILTTVGIGAKTNVGYGQLK